MSMRASEASDDARTERIALPDLASVASDDVGTELQFRPFERSVRLSRPRLRGFDYRGTYAYHVVVVVNGRNPVFGDPALGRWCLSVLEKTATGAQFQLLAYCLMPDHLHVLAQGTEDTSHLVTFLQRFKRLTGYYFKQESGQQLWQESYFDRVLRRDEDLGSVVAYIFENPVTAGLCTTPSAYALSGGTRFDDLPPDRTKVPSLHSDSQARQGRALDRRSHHEQPA